MARKPNRKARWSYSTGERGRNRVRAYEKAGSGLIMLEFYEPAPGGGKPKRRRTSTGHRDRDKAKRQADELAAEIAKAEAERPKPRDVTLQSLFDI